MQPILLCILTSKQFEETFENAQRRKVKQMQPMLLCILTGKRFEETFENAQSKNSNKCNQCDFASLQTISLRRHLKMHSEKSQTTATNVTLHPIR